MELPIKIDGDIKPEDPAGFRIIFKERFGRIKPLSESEGLAAGYDYNDIGIERVVRKIPAVIFESTNKGDYDLWIQDPDKPCGVLCHETIREELREFAKGKNPLADTLYPFSSYVVTGTSPGHPKKERVYLVIGRSFAHVIDQECKHDAGEDFVKVWGTFMKKYGLDVIAGKFEEPRSAGSILKDYYSPREIINCDILERIRENTELLRTAEGKLTYFEYLRLFAHYEANRDAGKNFDYYGEVEKIVEERKKKKKESVDAT